MSRGGKRVCIVGGGPAGLSAAIHAAGAGASVVLLEKNDACGVKLLATGGGHANVGNLLPENQWPALFGRHGRFIVPALELMPTAALTEWLAQLGQPVAATDSFHLFPVSNSARALRDALHREAERLGVRIIAGGRATGLDLADGEIRSIQAGGEAVEADTYIIAAGGRSMPSSGSNGDGARLAALAGHTITPQYPGLVGLRVDNLSPALAGLILLSAVVTLSGKGGGKSATTSASQPGRELLLTHAGISGPAVLDLSATVAQALGESFPPGDNPAASPSAVKLSIRWHADMAHNDWLQQFDAWRGKRGSTSMQNLLGQYLPRALAAWLLNRAGATAHGNAASLTAAAREKLAALLSSFQAHVTASEGWDKAMITRGGVSLKQVDPKTLGSKLIPNLYFAGETLDIDGPCGGYNLTWAFASGALAGINAAK